MSAIALEVLGVEAEASDLEAVRRMGFSDELFEPESAEQLREADNQM